MMQVEKCESINMVSFNTSAAKNISVKSSTSVQCIYFISYLIWGQNNSVFDFSFVSSNQDKCQTQKGELDWQEAKCTAFMTDKVHMDMIK